MKRAAMALVAVGLLTALACVPAARPNRRVVILGIDGLDPDLVTAMIQKGIMPSTFENKMKQAAVPTTGKYFFARVGPIMSFIML